MLANKINCIDNNLVQVSVELNVSGTLSMPLIEELNSACDMAEDISTNSIFLIRLIGCSNEAHANSKCSDVDVYLINKWEKALRRIEKLDSTIVTVTDSHLGGLGLAVILTSDYRIIAQNLKIALSDSSGNIMPGMLLYRLVHQLGSAKLRNFVLFGRELTSTEAKDINLIDEISCNTEKSVENFINSLDLQKIFDLAVRRRLLLEASSVSYEDALGTYLAACDRLLRRSPETAATEI